MVITATVVVRSSALVAGTINTFSDLVKFRHEEVFDDLGRDMRQWTGVSGDIDIDQGGFAIDDGVFPNHCSERRCL